MGIEGTYINVIKATYSRPTAHILLNWTDFSLRLGTRQGYPLSLSESEVRQREIPRDVTSMLIAKSNPVFVGIRNF